MAPSAVYSSVSAIGEMLALSSVAPMPFSSNGCPAGRSTEVSS